jgi:hypothetical protein
VKLPKSAARNTTGLFQENLAVRVIGLSGGRVGGFEGGGGGGVGL